MFSTRLARHNALFYWAAGAGALGCARTALGQFYMGSDISLVPYMEQEGAVFKATATSAAQPADQILYDAGDNLFRIRLFVNPNTTYSATEGAIQTLAYDESLATAIKTDDPNAAIMLDLHYSDTWASPGAQTTPSAWSGESLTQLESTIQSYTTSTLNAFASNGTPISIVQVGNEINDGILWPTGELNFNGTTAQQQASWQALGGLLNHGIAGVRAATGGSGIQVAIHIANGAETFTSNGQPSGEPQYFFSNLTNPTYGDVPASSFNIIGVSFYPNSAGSPSITLSGLQTNLTAMANAYPGEKFMVLETNYPYETLSNYNGWAETPAGQEEEIEAVKSLLEGLPNNAGEGMVYWYPEDVQVPGQTIYNGGATGLFSLEAGTSNTWIANEALGAFAVPEPASATLLSLALPLLLRRTRR
jgi:arabinogalactan endo-1,4-beta-galactosidase